METGWLLLPLSLPASALARMGLDSALSDGALRSDGGVAPATPQLSSGIHPPLTSSCQRQRRSWEDGDLSVMAKPPVVPG